MNQLAKFEGMNHINKVFEVYKKWLLIDMEEYRSSLNEVVDGNVDLLIGTRPAIFYYQLALEGFRRVLEKYTDEINQDLTYAEAIDILTD